MFPRPSAQGQSSESRIPPQPSRVFHLDPPPKRAASLPLSPRAGPKRASSALKSKYSPSDNSSSSSASLARTSAESDTGSRSAIPPLEKHFTLCFSDCFSVFFLVQTSPQIPKNPKLGPTVRVCRTVCASSAVEPPQNNQQVSANTADPLPGFALRK